MILDFAHLIPLDFEFPPGHRMRICNFVREIREMCSEVNTKSHACGKKGKRSVGKCSGRVHVKKTKLTSTDESESEVNVSTVSNGSTLNALTLL